MKPRRNKYHVAPKERRTDENGRVYASRAEMLYAKNLRLLGVEFIEQPRVTLGDTGIVYVPDFYANLNGDWVYIDVKGVETAAFRIKKKLWKLYGPASLHVVKRRGTRFVAACFVPKGIKT